jgi:hypothetical protein
MPNIDERIEWIAWAIFEEILKVHRKGFRYTTQTADRKSKCSQRVKLAAVAIKATAMARQRILEGCGLSERAATRQARRGVGLIELECGTASIAKPLR